MQFRDLQKQYEVLKEQIDVKVQEVCASTYYIAGTQVKELEAELAKYVGVKHCISCGNGTDALTLAIKAWKLGKGDVVFVPDFTFFSSGECPATEGCTCAFVDVEEATYNLNPDKLEIAIRKVIAEGKYRPRAVVAVDLFGQPADYMAIKSICEKYNLYLLEDGAQGFGGSIAGRKACSFGDIATTSFFPAKPLGCYGDGGAVFTNNDEWAALIRSYAVHGKAGNDKYNNVRLGMNSRLDTIQAAILQVKLKAFQEYELEDINKVAKWYQKEMKNVGLDKKVGLPIVKDGYQSSWAQYTILLPEKADRDDIQKNLKTRNIPTMIYYMKPMHRQEAFAGMDSAEADCPVTEQLCKRVLSLPMHPYMTEEQVKEVVNVLASVL